MITLDYFHDKRWTRLTRKIKTDIWDKENVSPTYKNPFRRSLKALRYLVTCHGISSEKKKHDPIQSPRHCRGNWGEGRWSGCGSDAARVFALSLTTCDYTNTWETKRRGDKLSDVGKNCLETAKKNIWYAHIMCVYKYKVCIYIIYKYRLVEENINLCCFHPSEIKPASWNCANLIWVWQGGDLTLKKQHGWLMVDFSSSSLDSEVFQVESG